MISRQDAFNLLKNHVSTDFLIKHSIATEAIMRNIARKFGENEDEWGIAGLLHDLDYDYTKDSPDTHTLKTAEILQEVDFPAHLIAAIKAHNAESIGISRENRIDYAITAAESITGLIVATALVYPDKKVASVKPKSVRKRMKEKAFARNVNRNMIRLCEEAGIPLDEFIILSLSAMAGIADELGL